MLKSKERQIIQFLFSVMNTLNTSKELKLITFHSFLLVEKSHNALLSLWFRVHWTVKILLPTEKMVTTKSSTFKIHSAIAEFRDARDPKLPWDHPFSYLPIKTTVTPFRLCAIILHCYYMSSSLQLSKTVRWTFFFHFTILRNLIVFQVISKSVLIHL